MKKCRFGAAVLACLLVLTMVFDMIPVSVEAASSSEIKNQITEMEEENEELKKQIKELKSKYKKNENEIKDIVAQKDLIDQEISLLTAQIANINRQITAFGLLIADKQDELDMARDHLAELNEKNKERIRAMEEEGGLSYWTVLFQANSFSDLLDRINMVQEIASSDQRRLKELQKAAEDVETARADLEVEKSSLEATKAELNATQAEQEDKRQESDKLLRKLIEKGEEYQAMLDESEQLQDDLMKEIAQKEKEYKEAKHQEWLATYVPPTTWPSDDTTPSDKAPSSSGWVCPVPYYTLTSPFGMRVHPIRGTWTMHNGVDMAAAQGTPIYAAKSGRVTVASFQAGGAGYYVSINHGDGFSSIYMHMTHYIVSPGMYVNAGQVIGYVGSTGGSTGPHLHFGISYNGTYVNPMNYI